MMISDKVPADSFFERSNARLHYLDWGGDGPDLLLLPGLGGTARIFSSFAEHFLDSHRVLGLTRRDHGQSSSTDRKYDIDTLVADIRSFLEYLGIKRITLMGHSMAGDEMTHFASTYPDQVSALVYLDAAFDRSALAEIRKKSPLVQSMKQDPPEEAWGSIEEYLSYAKSFYPFIVDRWDVWEEELLEGVGIQENGTVTDRFPMSKSEAFIEEIQTFKPQFNKVKCPALSICAISEEPDELPSDLSEDVRNAYFQYYREVMLPSLRDQARNFLDNVKHGRMTIVDGGHYIFVDKEEEIVPEIQQFLRELQ